MPKREDIRTILVIGAGPIVIGQACEFDYSGTQGCKALREEGYRVVLVNSNPATIMTDPEFAERTYIEPMTVESLEQIIARERPDAILPTLGGQTALNLAIALAEAGVLERYGVELIGAQLDSIHKAEDRERFREAMQKIGLKLPEVGLRALGRGRARGSSRETGLPAIIRPSFTLGGTGGGIACSHRGARADRAVGARPVAEPHLPRRAERARLEGVRARGDARPRRQRGHHLLDRELRSDGRAHGRLDHGGAGADAHRPRVPGDARRRDRDHPRDRRRHRRLEHPVRRSTRPTARWS